MKKKINIKKFLRSSIITILLVIALILILSNISLSHNNVNYKKISIQSGDTLWSIAKFEKDNNEYFENKDIRDIVYEIQDLNNLSSSNLKIGEQINIPIN